MRWRKLGLVWKPDGRNPWARTHGMAPTPYRISNEVIRIYVTSLDEKGRGRPGFVDVSARDPSRVLGESTEPLLDIGCPGSFDDNGVVATSLVEPKPGTLFMYYIGFELCTHIRFRAFSGLAISLDGGLTFTRYSRAPILDRTDEELFFRGTPFVMFDEGFFKMWYGAGSEWTDDIHGEIRPIVGMRYQESENGINWDAKGQPVLAITNEEEHGFSRPWVVKRAPDNYQLFYSVRHRSLGAYRLGYAESTDGIRWVRKDDELGLDVSSGEFDSEAILYSAVISTGDSTFCFYNGNRFGREGFGVAELIQ